MPQVEDGFTRIANELFDVILGAEMTGNQKIVLLAIIRKTYGYNKKEDDMSASQIGELCGMGRQHVTSALNALAEMNVINKRVGRYGSIIGIQKDYSKWTLKTVATSPKIGQVNDIRTGVQFLVNASPKIGQVDSPKIGHTKDNLSKDNQQKKTPCANAEAFARFWSIYPKRKSKAQAEKAFSKLNANEQLMAEIISGIEQAMTSDQWRKSSGQFIPHPATWLNARGWEDETESMANVDKIGAELQKRYGADVTILDGGRYRAGGRYFDSQGRPEVCL